jgi:hypothetical protein
MADGSMSGMLAGYQSWRELYFGIGSGTREACITGDIRNLLPPAGERRWRSDQETKEPTTISTTYYIEAVPRSRLPFSCGTPRAVSFERARIKDCRHVQKH